MIVRIFIIFFAATMALGQGPQKQPATPSQPAAAQSQPTPAGPPSLLKRDEAAASVAPTAPVLTVHGVCTAQTGGATKPVIPSAQDCVTTITKEQFDNLVNAFNQANQPVTPGIRRQMGQSYVDLLIFSAAAREAGVENSPTFIEVMRVLRLKTMSDLYRNQLVEQFRHPSPQEIDAYYQSNASKYEGVKLARIFIPKNDPNPQAKPDQKEAYQKKAEQVATDIRTRAAKGEPMDKLEKDAYAALGIASPPPSTDLSVVRHGVFPAKLDQEIFSHKAREAFGSDDGNGFMIYRVESRQPIPLDSVKDEIVRELARTKFDEKVKELTSPVHSDFNEDYFGKPVAAEPEARPIPKPSR
jgi:PPIC-type PPIASE domain